MPKILCLVCHLLRFHSSRDKFLALFHKLAAAIENTIPTSFLRKQSLLLGELLSFEFSFNESCLTLLKLFLLCFQFL